MRYQADIGTNLNLWVHAGGQRCCALLPELVRQLANPVDRDRHGVDRLLHDADADRCAAGDQIAGQERHVVRDLADELLRTEYHVGYGVVLPFGAVEDGAHHEACRIDAGRDDGTERAVAVKALGAGPLGEGLVAVEDVVGGDVVDAGVAEDEVVGVADGNVDAGFFDCRPGLAKVYRAGGMGPCGNAGDSLELASRPSTAIGFSSEAHTASRKENPSKQQAGALLIQSEPIRLYVTAIGAPRGATDPSAAMLSFSF
jgi:hypothetical protein